MKQSHPLSTVVRLCGFVGFSFSACNLDPQPMQLDDEPQSLGQRHLTDKDSRIRIPNCIFRASCFFLFLLLSAVVMHAPAQAEIALNSITVEPVNPAILVGENQAFVATGTFDDASTNPLLNSPVTALAGGERNGCALLGSGAVQCWGYNGNGQLGNGTTTQSSAPVQRDRNQLPQPRHGGVGGLLPQLRAARQRRGTMLGQ